MTVSLLLPFYLENSDKSVRIDVRSEGEFRQGHIPGSINLPLLNNQERAIVGTIYKQSGNKEAVQKGFELVGGKFAEFIEQAKSLAKHNSISVYCWRGGMRSTIMAWLFTTAGFQVNFLKGGYKSYRSAVLQSMDENRKVVILGGKTGSGKTEMLGHLKNRGEQVIDLESIAKHKGSAFGGLGQDAQPTNEQFENELFWQLRMMDKHRAIWFENESRLIGKNKIPDALYAQMRKANVIDMIVPLEFRIKRIVNEYGIFAKEFLEEATRKIERKLGNLRMKQAIEHLNNAEIEQWAKMMLTYYDNYYDYGMSQREADSIASVEILLDDYSKEVTKLMELKWNL